MPEKIPGTEVTAAVVQWQGQQNPLLCPSNSTVVVEQFHADPVTGPQMWKPF